MPVRYFEFVEGKSSKFWQIGCHGNQVTVRFGRIGTAGQTQVKTGVLQTSNWACKNRGFGAKMG